MILYREVSWRYWAATDVLLLVGLAGHVDAYYLAVALSVTQIAHFRWSTGAFGAFPTQVRPAYSGLLVLALLPPLRWLYWLPAIGTLAQVLFGYCFLARCLSLMPWSRNNPLTSRLIWRTFVSHPVKGNILQGLPAATSACRRQDDAPLRLGRLSVYSRQTAAQRCRASDRMRASPRHGAAEHAVVDFRGSSLTRSTAARIAGAASVGGFVALKAPR